MASTYTANKHIEQPASGDYANAWAAPVNTDWSSIDIAFGQVQAMNLQGVGPATITLGNTYTGSYPSTASYVPLAFYLSGAPTGNIIISIPVNVGGSWIVNNNTTGSYTISFINALNGLGVTIPNGQTRSIYSVPTNQTGLSAGVYFSDSQTATAGSNTQVIYNSGSALVGSANLIFDGTTLTTNALAVSTNITATGSITAGGNITAFSDRSLKTEIETIEGAIDLVSQLRGVRYTAINSGQKSVGVIAQEVEQVLPEVVQNNNGLLSVAYGNIVGLLIEAIKDLKIRIEELEKK